MERTARVILKPGKEHSLQRKHPWVFSGAIAQIDGQPIDGSPVGVYSHKGETLGTGHYAQGSIAVRMIAFEEVLADAEFWFEKIAQAVALRRQLGFLDNPNTNMFRLVHGEGDGMPGCIVDVYGHTAVIQTHTEGMFLNREMIAHAIVRALPSVVNVFDRGREKIGQRTNDKQGSYLIGKAEGMDGLEHGCRFLIDWEKGQKTGFFLDQRENRKLLGELSKGKRVLNTFCYTGGFSVYALLNGATEVHSLDSSQSALDLARENASINGFDEQMHRTICADAVGYMRDLNESYDIIVLDPPAFAKNIGAKHKAIQAYIRINAAAMRNVKSGGFLFTFSCSQVIDAKLFRDSVMAAAIQSGRTMRIVHQLHQPADHPISLFHPEGEYLKGLVIQMV
ncbi:MAG: class I SAM-dependent rRNA methyltransferase [Flavobacteriales bacterium]